MALGCITLTVLCLKPKDIVNIASGCHKSIAALFTSLFSLPEQQKIVKYLDSFSEKVRKGTETAGKGDFKRGVWRIKKKLL